jgi:hypothetical protein
MLLRKLLMGTAVLALSLGLVGTSGQAQERPIAAVWANNGEDKVTRDELRSSADPTSVINSVWDGSAVAVFGARNEVIAFNLILEAPTTTATDVSVNFDTLTGPDGYTIHSEPTQGDGVFDWTNRQIELFYVRYLEIKGLSELMYGDYDERHVPERMRRPWSGDGEGTGGWEDRPEHNAFYPDIAVPLELVPSFVINAGQNQSIWVDIYIPKDAPAGLYTGTVTIMEHSTVTHTIPVELTVRDFTLPDVPHAATMVDLTTEDIGLRYLGDGWLTRDDPRYDQFTLIQDRHFLLAHRHRIAMLDDTAAEDEFVDQPRPEWIPRLDGTLFTAAQGYDGPGVGVGNGVYSIGTYGNWSWQDDGEAAMRQHSDAWVTWFETYAPGTEYFLYLVDESDDYPQTEQWAAWIENNPGPGHRLKSFATVPLPDAVAYLPSLDIPAAWAGFGIPDEWESAAEVYRNDPDRRLYMYNSFRPAVGSFATEDDGVALRQLAWTQYKKGVDRWFFWNATYYNNYQCGAGETNVFQQAQTFGCLEDVDSIRGETGWNYSNGDGVLMYPGTDTVYPEDSYGVQGPFASLRLKHWRRGIQDVDYLVLAAEIDPQRVQTIVETMIPAVLWEVGVEDLSDPSWVLTDISWSSDPDVWEAARAELADIIEHGQ